MANSFVASRAQLVYALCLPLAVLLGYYLADPMDTGTITLVVAVLAVLSFPVLMNWYHLLLICSWNAALAFAFLPGQPFLWMLLSVLGLVFAVTNRITQPDARFIIIPSITRPLLLLFAVVALTAWFRGGIGLKSFGSTNYGGKSYVYLFAAILGYFTLTSQRIPKNRAALYTGVFFISGLTAVVPNLAYLGGPHWAALFNFFPALYAVEQALADYRFDASFTRVYGLTLATLALFCWLLSQYGVRGLFEPRRPWRALLLLLGFGACLFSGFRGLFIFLLLMLALQAYLEGLFRPRVVLVTGVALGLAAAIALPNADKLPLVVQRTISFLPVNISPIARINAEGSAQWRWQMWQDVLPLVPQYLLAGKGYGIDRTELEFVNENSRRGYGPNYAGAIVANDFHSGPLTLIIPLGIWGALAFGWFVVVALRYLLRQYRHGDPELRGINTFLLTYFVARLVGFLFIFGAFPSDLFFFTGTLGLSVSLNGAELPEPVEAKAEEEPEQVAYQEEFAS
jgi:hypothetical protein